MIEAMEAVVTKVRSEKEFRFCIDMNSNNYRIFISLMNGDETPSKWDKIAKAPKDSQPFDTFFRLFYIFKTYIY